MRGCSEGVLLGGREPLVLSADAGVLRTRCGSCRCWHRRGGPSVAVTGPLVGRSTPASAGRTWASSCKPASRPEHLRGAGGPAHPSASFRHTGAPSCRRGGRPRRFSTGIRDRNTPASAGRTLAPSCSRRAPPEPPPRQGEPEPQPSSPHRARSTPSLAGTTPPCRSSGPPKAEHPRVGGEAANSGIVAGNAIGAPPRRRGRLPVGEPEPTGRRNIPASAGRTRSAAPVWPWKAEHPRVGREDVARPGIDRFRSGTPLRRRGGLTPADLGVADVRSTPASAGRTLVPRVRSEAQAEYPRVGGEDQRTSVGSGQGIGTPPRRRVGH